MAKKIAGVKANANNSGSISNVYARNNYAEAILIENAADPMNYVDFRLEVGFHASSQSGTVQTGNTFVTGNIMYKGPDYIEGDTPTSTNLSYFTSNNVRTVTQEGGDYSYWTLLETYERASVPVDIQVVSLTVSNRQASQTQSRNNFTLTIPPKKQNLVSNNNRITYTANNVKYDLLNYK